MPHEKSTYILDVYKVTCKALGPEVKVVDHMSRPCRNQPPGQYVKVRIYWFRDDSAFIEGL
jgi:hypothetical protein